MLKKMFKYDWKSSWKVPTAINVFLILITFIGILSLVSPFWKIESDYMAALLAFAIVFYYIAICAGSIAVNVYMAVRYYKSIYSDEGYLTNTLPVTARQLVLSKVFIGVIWTFITGVVVTGSILGLIFVAGITSVEVNIFAELATLWTEILPEFLSIMGMNVFSFIVFCILYFIIGTFFSILMMYSAVALGQLFTRHKVAGAIIWYIAEYTVIQMGGSLLVNLPLLVNMNPNVPPDNSAVSTFINLFLIGSLVISLVLSIVLYFITERMLAKKLNLD